MNDLTTLRAELAGKAMQVILPIRINQLTGCNVNIAELVATESVAMADAIIKELNNPQK